MEENDGKVVRLRMNKKVGGMQFIYVGAQE